MGIINLPWTSGILSTLFFLFLNTSAVAATYTVDSNNVTNVITAAKPGDVIVFKNGTYSNVNINFKANGTATNPITLRAQSSLGVTFNGASTRLTVQGNWLIVDGFRFLDIQHSDDRPVLAVYGSSHSIVRNNEFKNSGRVAGTSTGIMRVANGSTYNTITHNRFDDVTSMGIQIWAYQSDHANPHNTISWNHFINNEGSNLLQIGAEDADYNTIIENNLFENSCLTRCGNELISNRSSYNIYRYNTFRNAGKAGPVTLRLGQGVTVDSNLFLTSGGLRVFDANHRIVNNYFFGGSGMLLSAGSIQGPESPPGYRVAAQNAFVANNTFFNSIWFSSTMLIIGHGYGYDQPGYGVWKYAPQNVVVQNNVMVNDGGTAIYDLKSVNTKWANNIVWPTKTGKAGYTGPGVTVRDPKLAGTSQPYHILSTSPAIDAGVAVSWLKYDMDGQPRLGAPDVGSDEWSTAPVTHNPLTASQVGPPSGGPSDATPPSVSLTAPASGATISGTITVAATASDNVGVLGVQFKRDGVNLGSEGLTTPYSVAFPTTGVPNGPHTLTAVARDAAGNTKTSSAITVTVNNDTTPPTVSITAPANGATVSGTVTVAATAADNAGVVDVQFWVDGILIAQDATAPYTTAWTTIGLSNGSHTLTAVARDAAGNTTTSSAITVTVNTTPPTWVDENFESASWADPYSVAKAYNALRTSAAAHSGGFGVRMSIPKGSNWGSTMAFHFNKHGLPKTEEVWMRTYVRFAPTWGTTQGHNVIGHGGLTWASEEVCPAINHQCLNGIVEGGREVDIAGVFSPLNKVRGQQFSMQNALPPPGNYSFSQNVWPAELDMNKDQWYCMEAHVKLNTPGVANGIYESFLNGQAAASANNWTFLGSGGGALKIGWVGVGALVGGTWVADADTYVDFDDFAAGSARIGCGPLPTR